MKKENKTEINEMNDLIIDNPSFKKYKKDIKYLKILTKLGFFNPNFKKEGLSNLNECEKILNEFKVLDEFNKCFQKKGWIAFGLMNLEIMKKAVDIANEENVDLAEKYLVEELSKDLEFHIQFLVPYPEELSIRKDLINLAYEDYKSERYYSCVMLLFSIIDGFVADSKDIASGKGFYAASDEIYSWDGIASHKSGLNEIQKLIYSNRGKTNPNEITIPYRNGIMHGRDLNFNNKCIATKLWFTLFALKEGILDIKNKGRNPPEKKEKNNLKDVIQKFKDDSELLKNFKDDDDKWENRHLKIDTDFKDSQDLNDFEEGTPEYALVQFFNYWLNKNFGYMAKMEYRFTFGQLNINKEAGKIKGIFNDKILDSFKIMEINDESMLISNITTEITIMKDSEKINETLKFRLVYEDDKDGFPVRSLNKGKWKIANFSNIKNKIKEL